MRRALVAVAAAALLVPAAARPVPCSPLNCGPSQFTFARGTLLGVRNGVGAPLRVIDLRTGRTRWRLPPGVVTRDTLVHLDGKLLTWYDAAHGARLHDAVLQARGAFALVGTSQDGSTAVLARTQVASTTFALVSPSAQRTVRLAGNAWSFDALRGRSLFLIERLGNDAYQVRLYDLSTRALLRQPLRDPQDGATIDGIPFARVPSVDGRYLFTLYVGTSGGAMVHELDTVARRAYCIDLPGDDAVGAATTWALVPGRDGSALWAVSAGEARLVAIDARAHTVRLRRAFERSRWTANAGTAVLAPDGEHIAFTDAQHVWVATLGTGEVVAEQSHVAIALGFAPDQSALWVVGERSRVSRLTPLRWR